MKEAWSDPRLSNSQEFEAMHNRTAGLGKRALR